MKFVYKRVCCDCGLEKGISQFNFANKEKNIRKYFCKDCAKIKRKKNKENTKKYHKQWYLENREKKLEQSNRWKKENKKQKQETDKIYRKTHRKEMNEYAKDYYDKNIEKIRKQKMDAYYNNLEHNRMMARNRRRERYKNDINWRIKVNVQRYFSKVLSKTFDFTYRRNFESLVDYSIEDLLENIESKFEPWMNWDNYGRQDKEIRTWQIDHIIAVSLYNACDREEIKKCWNLRNLRPLDSKENNIKWNKFDWELIEEFQIQDLLPKIMLEEDI